MSDFYFITTINKDAVHKIQSVLAQIVLSLH